MKETSKDPMGTPYRNLGLTNKLQSFLYRKSGIAITVTVLFLMLILYIQHQLSRNMDTFSSNDVMTRHSSFYGIMLDAGSTGSRVHVYEFQKTNETIILLDELFEQVKPGLSSYADRPHEGAESISKLLEIAKNRIPINQWKETPVALKATAGLRLLPKQKSEEILLRVSKVIMNSPFLKKEDPVMIMDGADEGISGWLTVNYLLGNLDPDTVQYAVGMIDLGGGSMQIAFAPHQKESFSNVPTDYKHRVSVLGINLQLYVHSYLGFGLMSARQATLEVEHPNTADISTPCMKSGFKTSWSNAGKSYKITGSAETNNLYQQCRAATQAAIEGRFVAPEEIKHQPFYVFSYFYDRASEAGLIDEDDGGSVTVNSFIQAAQTQCGADGKFSADNPFVCMDLCILSTFLQDGFGFDADTRLTMKKTIDDKETSWTLGATFSLFDV